MPESRSEKSSAVIATVQYELTDDIACRSAVDLLERRIAQGSGRLSALGGVGPVVVLVGAAVQILIAIAAVVFFGGWYWIVSKVLIVIGVVVMGILLWKAAFYSLPSLGRWYVCRQAVRQVHRLAHRRIQWLLYEDHLETESASAHRRIAWSEVSQMTRCGQSIVLILRSGVELVIPASVLSAEAQSILARRIVS
jgi:hypothetical protein